MVSSTTFVILFLALEFLVSFKFTLVRVMKPNLYFSGGYPAFPSQMVIKFIFSMPF